ncbi:hypothetical protein [Bradyrhizobium sp. NC92]|uniref:hypothetical protein n=1 Tax=Bradyrhizobium sp. (strain NC92) TaxID=55395 RepID=UPI0021AA9895|nr:hypothetical protein [Bradyrhizobium sp. NC92]UWU65548.1 hypothetical protein N2602_19940 [Bradyrhizobium sp. NC92]
MTEQLPEALKKQAEPIYRLISYAREQDRLGKVKSARHALIAARRQIAEQLGETFDPADVEVEVKNGRRRIRKAADTGEHHLKALVSSARLWDWTDPDRAIRDMRAAHFGFGFSHLPLTDIEADLVEKGNVLFILAIYPTLKFSILRRLQTRGVENVQPAATSAAPTTNETDE